MKATWHERLARAGRLRPGSQAWGKLKVTKLVRNVDIQSSLRDVREAPVKYVDTSAVLPASTFFN